MTTAALDSLLHWLLRTSLEASVLILGVLGLRALLRTRLSPAWRIGLWMIVGLKLLLPACIPAGFGLGQWWAAKTQATTAPTSVVVVVVPVANTVDSAVAAPASPETLASPAAPAPRQSAAIVWFALWAAGVLIALGAALIRQRRFERQLATRPSADDPRLLDFVLRLAGLAGVRQPVRVILLPAGATPAVVGCHRPRLLLPEDWESRFDDASLRHVLLHELQHIRQRDLIWNWIALAVQALHWFNPLVWLAATRFQADRELRCDARALALLAPNERLSYGRTLLRVQETFFAPPAIAGLAPCVRNHPTLRQRITMIAQPSHQRPWIHALFALSFVLITCYAFTTVRAAEGEVPAKDRSREGARPPAAGERERPKTGERDGAKPNTGERDGAAKKTGARDGAPRTGPRDGDGKKTGARDEESPKTGERDDARKKSGEREGATRTGPREGEGKRTGSREGERPKTGEREGGKSAEKRGGTGESIAVQVTDGGDSVVVAGEKMPAKRLRAYLQTFLADKGSAKVTITGDTGVTREALFGVQDAVRDNGAKNVHIESSNSKE